MKRVTLAVASAVALGGVPSVAASLHGSFRRQVARRFCRSTRLSVGTEWASGATPLSWEVTCATDEDIESLGRCVAEFLGTADVILLKGDLGAGKTTFSRGLIRAKFDDESMRVTSPSYLLDNTYEYDEGLYIHHMDLYRLPTGCDLSMLGIPGIYASSLCLIEWPQRMSADHLPPTYLEMDFKINADESRRISLTARGARWEDKLPQLVKETQERLAAEEEDS